MKQSIWWQSLLPQQLLTTFVGKLANCKSRWFKNWAITKFVKHYQVDLTEAAITTPKGFSNFNDFFTRHLKPGRRPIDSTANTLVSPVDGTVSALGSLHNETILQAKGKKFNVTSLLGDPRLAKQFIDGCFLTAYLSPKDYHRFHMPFTGQLREMHYIPGKLFSVNEASVAGIDNLFAKNERVILIFDSEIGPFAYVAVGAMIVGSIGMNWHGVVNAKRQGQIKSWFYRDKPIRLERGQECGYFQLGSTVILLFPQGSLQWDSSLRSGACLHMGAKIATMNKD